LTVIVVVPPPDEPVVNGLGNNRTATEGSILSTLGFLIA